MEKRIKISGPGFFELSGRVQIHLSSSPANFYSLFHPPVVSPKIVTGRSPGLKATKRNETKRSLAWDHVRRRPFLADVLENILTAGNGGWSGASGVSP